MYRCFSCASEKCELSGRVAGSEVDVAPCVEGACTGKMRVKRTGPRNAPSYMLFCSVPTCKAVWWMPKFVKSGE